MSNSVRVPAACLFCEEEDDDGVYDPFRHLEVVGLLLNGNGRKCAEHDVCGKQVHVGDILRIKKTVVATTDGTSKEALCCVLVRGGEERCRVAFILRFLMNSPLVQQNINKYLQVVDLFDSSDSLAKQAKSKQYGGVAGVVFLEEIPALE